MAAVHSDPIGENRPIARRAGDGDPHDDLSAGRQCANVPVAGGACASIGRRRGGVEIHVSIERVGDGHAGRRGAAGIGVTDGVCERCAGRGRGGMCSFVQRQHRGVYRGGDGGRNRGGLIAIRRGGIGDDRPIGQGAIYRYSQDDGLSGGGRQRVEMPVGTSPTRPPIGSDGGGHEGDVSVERVRDGDVAGGGVGAGVLASQGVDQRIANLDVPRMGGFGHCEIGRAAQRTGLGQATAREHHQYADGADDAHQDSDP